MTCDVLTSARSRECRGQGDDKDQSPLGAGAVSWQPPKAQAGCHGCGSDGSSSSRSPRSQRTSDDDASTWVRTTDSFRTIAPRIDARAGNRAGSEPALSRSHCELGRRRRQTRLFLPRWHVGAGHFRAFRSHSLYRGTGTTLSIVSVAVDEGAILRLRGSMSR